MLQGVISKKNYKNGKNWGFAHEVIMAFIFRKNIKSGFVEDICLAGSLVPIEMISTFQTAIERLPNGGLCS
jgi:hypothetical protein